ncbi:diaminopimelate epimerase [Thioflexithrix psekupsensis]
MMKLPFTKMQGLGNDFVVIESLTTPRELTPEQIRFLANRHFGVGCDQVLWVGASEQEGVDFTYRIFNADGGEVFQCGNGVRCFARYVFDKGFTTKTNCVVQTKAGIMRPVLEPDGLVTVEMGQARFLPAQIPLRTSEQATRYQLDVAGETVEFGAVSLGNPHAVLQVDSVDTAPVDSLGRLLESHRFFPERVNVGFMEVISASDIRLRVFERGVGETLACGSGACAAVIIGRLWSKLSDTVTVQLRGGELRIRWSGDINSPIWMTGPAVTVFEGVIEL